MKEYILLGRINSYKDLRYLKLLRPLTNPVPVELKILGIGRSLAIGLLRKYLCVEKAAEN